MLSRYSFAGGRRKGGRRSDELRNVYIDQYPFGIALLVLGIFLLNVADALFTLLHLQAGGEEFNPIVAQILHLGPQWFFLIKSGVTAGCLVFLLLHLRFFVVRKLFGAVFGIYCGVFAYHIYLNSL